MPPAKITSSLGTFIRKHRERIRPEEAGIRRIGRSRTPGLRREELAALCEVSPTWITWLEQGRPVSASSSLLEKLASALHLTDAERNYLFRLGGKAVGPVAAPTPADMVLECLKFVTTPAYVLDRFWNAIAWNGEAEALFEGWLTKDSDRNLLRFVFLDPQAKILIEDWPFRAKRLAAEFRADCDLAEEEAGKFVEEMLASSPDFSKFWLEYDVIEREGGLRTFNHEKRGRLSYNQITFHPATRRDLKLVLLIPF